MIRLEKPVERVAAKGHVSGFVHEKDKTDPVVGGLSMPPSEFIRRAVRFTPYATEDAGVIIREGGEELFLFSSDYPHPEGTHNPIERFEKAFEGFSEEAKDRFYRRNFEDMFAA